MPTVNIDGFKFRFYSSDRGEPPHVHVIQGEHVAKIWLTSLSVEYNHGYNRAALNRIIKLTQQYQEELLEVWNEYFN